MRSILLAVALLFSTASIIHADEASAIVLKRLENVYKVERKKVQDDTQKTKKIDKIYKAAKKKIAGSSGGVAINLGMKAGKEIKQVASE